MSFSRKNLSIISLLSLILLAISSSEVAAKAESSVKDEVSKVKGSKSKGSKVKGSKSKGSKSKGSKAGLPQEGVRLETESDLEQCDWVVAIWQKMGGKTIQVDSLEKTACCYYIGSEIQTSGIPGVRCGRDGTVVEIVWRNKGLTGPIPRETAKLVDLKVL